MCNAVAKVAINGNDKLWYVKDIRGVSIGNRHYGYMWLMNKDDKSWEVELANLVCENVEVFNSGPGNKS